MSYLICRKCGKEYPLPEGKESFYYDTCDCGGKLEYSPIPKREYDARQMDIPQMEKYQPGKIKDYQSGIKNYPQSLFENSEYTKQSPPPSRIKWKGIILGISFLLVSMLISVMLIFGENIPTNTTDIPIEFLTYLALIFSVLTIIAGFISAYLSGSKNFLEGALNGGMVGIILGFILGILSGTTFLINIIVILGSMSMIGGIIWIFPRKLFK